MAKPSSRLGYRPVSIHIMEFLEQHVGEGFCIADLIKGMAKQGWRHGGNAILDNCRLLIEQGKIIGVWRFYGIPKDGNINVPKPPPKQISLPKQQQKQRYVCLVTKPKPSMKKRDVFRLAEEWDKFDGSYSEFLKIH
jgi:hypothetical protein